MIAALEPYAPPVRVSKLDALLARGDVRAALDNVVPSEMYLLAVDMADKDRDSPAGLRYPQAGRGGARRGKRARHLAHLRHAQADARQLL